MDFVTDKVVTFVLPCYNAAAYMDHCIETLLEGARDDLQAIEVVIVDDGSTTDSTAAKADEWQERHPGVIKAVHQENGGHGQAVNTGLAQASGTYFKVVDADDWVDVEAARALLAKLTELARSDDPVDLLITNYVYEKVLENTSTPMRYRGILPEGRVFGWSEVGKFGNSQYLLMHSVVYRTRLLRAIKLELPKHTFYVDNVFVYVPLPHVRTIYYLDIDLYRYFIGREGQSVNEATMVSRIDQQLRITRIMIEAFDLERDIENRRLKAYMVNYLSMMMAICSVFLLLSKRADAPEQRAAIWDHLKSHNAGIYPKIRHSLLGASVNLPGKLGRATTLVGYHLAQKIFKFN